MLKITNTYYLFFTVRWIQSCMFFQFSNKALFIISDRSSHTTGQFVIVDGGYVHLDRSLINDVN